MDGIKKEMESYWARRAEKFSCLRRREFGSEKHGQWLLELEKYLPSGRPLDILDIGTGTGFFALLLAQQGHRVTGIDLTPEMIAQAGKMADELGISARFLVMDAEAPEFAEGSFDAIVTRKLTWTLPHLDRAYANWRRLLRPGGVLINYDADYCREKEDAPLPAHHAHQDVDAELLEEYRHMKKELCPLQQPRPQWDVSLLREAGFGSIAVDTGAWKRIYREMDEFYDPTPGFVITAKADRYGQGREGESYRQENIAYWSKRAPGYSQVNQEELSGGQRNVWRNLLDGRIRECFPGRARGDIRLLDIGAGPGFFSIILAELGYRVTAVDYTEAMLDQARKNAGSLAGQIDFRQMDAEALLFADGSFDVAVSRNLTWNLNDPKRAYGEWARVLKQGGLLLNFDANWYRYLYDAGAKEGHRADREKVRTTGTADDTAGTDVAAMERIARKAPLSLRDRPGWDLEILKGLGMQVHAETDIWKEVWTREEWINNASTPMFLVCGRKVSAE